MRSLFNLVYTESWRLFVRTLQNDERHQRFVSIVLVTNILSAFVQGFIPLVWLLFVDSIVVFLAGDSSIDKLRFDIIFLSALFFLLRGTQILCVAILERRVGKFRASLSAGLRGKLFRKFQTMSFAYFDKRPVGELMSNLWSDTNLVSNLVTSGLNSLTASVIGVVVMLSIIFFYSSALSLLIIVTIPPLFLVAFGLHKRIGLRARQAMQLGDEVNVFFGESLDGIHISKAFNKEQFLADRFNLKSSAYQDVSQKIVWLSSFYAPLVICLSSVAVCLILVFGGVLSMNAVSGISIGTWGAFFGYTRGLFIPVLDITQFIVEYQTGIVSARRIFEKLDEQPAIHDKHSTGAFGAIKGDIKFQNVFFEYKEDKPVLQKFNLHIRAGESIGLVGMTGSGKTTIINLISRFYEPHQGRILIDDIDYRTRSIESYRSQIGVILQDPYLLTGDVYYNITYGAPQTSRQEVKTLLMRLGADDLAEKLDHEVGGDGKFLSAGQQQIVALARVILKNPRIIIMDEFSSSIDTGMEERIQKGIADLIAGRTCVIIAHRLSTIKNCDRILVIQDGQVVEDGSHGDLVECEGLYHALLEDYQR